jgi:glycosyltransferase involved in cell wall biosynthesis
VEKPVVSIIIPVRNEELFISKCLNGIINQTYPIDKLEILVVDGLSDDKTKEIVEEYSNKYPQIQLLENKKKITPVAMNIGIKKAKGKYIMLSGAHSEFPENYIEKCIHYIEESDADNVGGIVKTKPRKNTLLGKVIAEVLSSPFGVGGAKFRTGTDKPVEVDTVPFGFYKKDVFDKIGLVNEDLVRNQDIDLNLRLKRAGGKIILFPDIQLTYYARSTLKELWKNNFGNGFWIIYGTKFSKIPFSTRHLIPLLFVSSLIVTGILSFFLYPFFLLFIAIVALYTLTNILFSIRISTKINNWRAFFISFFTFFVLHVSYGVGSLKGVFSSIGGKR